MKAVLLDIEGTTTPIDFVHITLFPFARERVSDYVAVNFELLRHEIAELKTEHSKETSFSAAFDEHASQSVSDYLKFLIDADRKSKPLKSIQGKIWQEGYESGELRSVVFDDVPRAFKRWKSDGKTIAIYSSGSVLAQRLLFRYTDHGDLTTFISMYFDTNIGGKRESESYGKIAVELDFEPSEILFVSDITAELDAAKAAKMQTALTVRVGKDPVIDYRSHTVVRSFDDSLVTSS